MSSPSEVAASVRASWRAFLSTCEPLRGDLFRYCRHLTRSPWDAEDLVQDTLARAFATLANLPEGFPNPRAWLFRVASNLWINRLAHEGKARDAEPRELAVNSEPRGPREAAGTLIAQLSPQERAAVVLKDVFDLSLLEIAEALSTTPGAIKAALHRGRGKLVEPPQDELPLPARPVLDAFCGAMNAGDLDALTALLLDTAIVETPGVRIDSGAEAARSGTLHGLVLGCADGPRGVSVPRAELRSHRGEPVILCWRSSGGGREEVYELLRLELEGDRVAHVRVYFHAPELVAEVCEELQVPYRPQLYA